MTNFGMPTIDIVTQARGGPSKRDKPVRYKTQHKGLEPKGANVPYRHKKGTQN